MCIFRYVWIGIKFDNIFIEQYGADIHVYVHSILPVFMKENIQISLLLLLMQIVIKVN